jgi:hypothetical protein
MYLVGDVMVEKKIFIDMRELNNKLLTEACNKVMGALAEYSIEYQIAALHVLIDTCPIKYTLDFFPDGVKQ